MVFRGIHRKLVVTKNVLELKLLFSPNKSREIQIFDHNAYIQDEAEYVLTWYASIMRILLLNCQIMTYNA